MKQTKEMTEKQRKRIKKFYGQKRKAENSGCSCFVCKNFDEHNGRCLKRRKEPDFTGIGT